MKWSVCRSGARALLLSLSLPLAAFPAHAVDVTFDDLVSLSDVAPQSPPGVSISTALVLSEADVEALTTIQASGTWATSGDQGLFNTYAPNITFTFSQAVTSFSVDVLSLLNDGVTLAIRLRAYDAENIAGDVLSDIAEIGNSGYHEQTLSFMGHFTRVELMALEECDAGLCESQATSTFWLDTVSFTPVPEPGTAVLAGVGLTFLASLARGRGRRS